MVAFHANVSGLGGGYAGVDVFFVVSGYLITGLILPQIERGTFSFAEFYVRRINRILPALIVILVASLGIGWVILIPEEFRQLGRHILGGSTFSSNFILWQESGYFDSQDKPLLHLWSLAVEEQFYLLWPALALLTWKWLHGIRRTVVGLIVISFALSVWMATHQQGTGAFFSPASRFWEIMAGALLVHAELGSKNLEARAVRLAGVNNLMSVVGTVMLITAFVELNRDTLWPGWWAALPVIGTVLLVAAGSDAWINRHVLSNRVLVYVGLISYPLYLWHWPLIVMARIVKATPLSERTMSGIVAISVILAILTFHFVEKPIRFGARKRRSALVLMCLLAGIGLAGFAMQGGAVTPRMRGDDVAIIDSAVHDWTYPGEGGIAADGNLIVHTIAGDTARKILFLGDSHGEQYWPRMLELAREAGGRQPEIDFITYGGCTPFPNAERFGLDWQHTPFRCHEFNGKAMQIAADPRVATIVYSFWWEANFNADRFLLDVAGKPLVRSTGADSLLVFKALRDEIQQLRNAGKEVYIVLSNPQSVAYRPTSLLQGRLPWFSTAKRVTRISRNEHEQFAAFTNAHLREVAAVTGAVVITPADFLCTKSECPTIGPNGEPIYKDSNHMRASFAREHATFIDRVLGQAR